MRLSYPQTRLNKYLTLWWARVYNGGAMTNGSKTNYTIHLKIGTITAKRLNRIARIERRTAHQMAVLILEDGIAQKEITNGGQKADR